MITKQVVLMFTGCDHAWVLALEYFPSRQSCAIGLSLY